MKRITMLLAGTGLAACTLATAAPVVATAAPASSTATATTALPKIQHFGMSGIWSSSFRVRPGTVFFGAHFFIKDLRYSHYGSRSATASGRLAIDNCRPNCAQGGHFVNASAVFIKARDHRGPGLYYSGLNLTWPHHVMHLWISGRGSWDWR